MWRREHCRYFIHALPFTNSSINWVLYGALNGQLQQRYRGSRSNTQTNLKEAATRPLSTKVSMPVAPSPSSHVASSLPDGDHVNPAFLRFGDWNEPREEVDVRLLPSHEPTFL